MTRRRTPARRPGDRRTAAARLRLALAAGLSLAGWAGGGVASPSAALAADHFLTIGGGDSPARNQVSLEKNVLYLQRVLDDVGAGKADHDIFFADGDDPGRDVQLHASAPVPRVNQLLAQVLTNNDDAVGLTFKSAQIPHVRGPSTRKSLTEWFDEVGSKLEAGDRLVVYFTGHGGGGPNRQPRNTTMTLWRENAMPVSEFVGLLDKLPPKVSVVLVMVQCHAGGFADVIFKNPDDAAKAAADVAKGTADPKGGADPKAGGGGTAGETGAAGERLLADADRCGFFATVPERMAAGCTADIAEENYHEYSTSFWEAISGHSRLGSAVAKPDFDGDGHVSFAEAHAHVKLTSGTIDLPISTSDVFLRTFSRAPGMTTGGGGTPPGGPPNRPGGGGRRAVPTNAAAAGPASPAPGPASPVAPPAGFPPLSAAARKSAAPVNTASPVPAEPESKDAPSTRPADGGKPDKGGGGGSASPREVEPLLSVDAPYEALVAKADPARKAVVDGLSTQLGLGGPARAKAARELLGQLQRRKESVENQKQAARRDWGFARDKVAAVVRGRWPELSTPFHPAQLQILRDQADEVVKTIEGHEAYGRMEEQRVILDKLDDQSMEADRKWVKAQRFLRTLEDITLAANLPKVASPAVCARYEKLLAAEYGWIGKAE